MCSNFKALISGEECQSNEKNDTISSSDTDNEKCDKTKVLVESKRKYLHLSKFATRDYFAEKLKSSKESIIDEDSCKDLETFTNILSSKDCM